MVVGEGMERKKVTNIKKVDGQKEIRKLSDMLKILFKIIDKVKLLGKLSANTVTLRMALVLSFFFGERLAESGCF